MAKDPQSESDAVKKLKAALPQASPSTMPYLVASGLVLAVMAWYMFSYVPEQLNYFVGLRFRNLAVASGQVQSKIDSLVKAFELAEDSDQGVSDLTHYLETLIPEIRPIKPSAARLAVGSSKMGSTTVGWTVAWEDFAQQAALASRGSFDDLILADATGAVVWQRERNSPRIGNLNELMNSKAEGGGGWLPLSFSWNVQTTPLEAQGKTVLPGTAVLKQLNLDGTPVYVVIQQVPVAVVTTAALPDARRLFVAGVISRASLQAQAMHVPTTYVLAIALSMTLLFLAIPYLKLATLTSKERYRLMDVMCLAAAAMFVAGIAGMLPFLLPVESEAGDRALANFSQQIGERFANETEKILKVGSAIAHQPNSPDLIACEVEVKKWVGKKPCGLWEGLERTDNIPMELDVVMWVDPKGNQSKKWTTKTQVTVPTPHLDFAHYQDIVARRTWYLRSGTYRERFTIEPLRAPTTAEMGVVFAIPDGEGLVAFNVRPQTVVDPLIPPGYGFALLAPDGQVLFHSQEGLSLWENFFKETRDPADTATRARSGRPFTWTTDYHGRSHRVFMRTFEEFGDCPWLIVTFQELDPLSAAKAEQQGMTLELFGTSFLILILGLGCAALLWTVRGQNFRDMLLDTASVDSRSSVPSKKSMRWLLPMAVAAVVGIALTYVPSLQGSLDFFYVFFAVLPLAAFWVAAHFRKQQAIKLRSGDPGLPTPGLKFDRLAIELALVVLVAGALPAAGFARIAYRIQQRDASERQLEFSSAAWSQRRTRVRDRLTTRAYRPATQAMLLTEPEFAGEIKDGVDPKYNYLGIGESVGIQIGPRVSSTGKPTDWGILRWLLRSGSPSPTLARLSSGPPPARFIVEGGNTGTPTLSTPVNAGSFSDLWSRWSLFSLCLLGVVWSAVYWARRKLGAMPVVTAPSIDEQVASVSVNGNEIVLLIGTPRSMKDQLAMEAIRWARASQTPPIGRFPAYRVPLSDPSISDGFMRTHLEKIRAVESDPSKWDCEGRLWLQVSNLETQLVSSVARGRAMQFLEKLLVREDDKPVRSLIVTSSVDPIAHFEELFQEERRGAYMDAIPEVELSRTSLLLTRFRRCYSNPLLLDEQGNSRPHNDRDPWNRWLEYEPMKWKETLRAEVGGYPPLRFIEHELRAAWVEQTAGIAKDSLALAIRNKAEAAYSLLWASCTRSEKLVLVQLAQEGFVNPKSREILAQLVAKGLIVQRPAPAIFNYTFRGYLLKIERTHIIHEWEKMEGAGLWQVSGRLIASIILVCGVFFLMTQDFPVQSLVIPIISGSGALGIPMLRSLMATISSKTGTSVG